MTMPFERRGRSSMLLFQRTIRRLFAMHERVARLAGPVILAAALSMSPALAEGRTITAAFEREVTITSAERIITLGPDVSEIAFALGAGDRIVALDRGSKFPAEATEKPNVGYRRQLSAEGVLALRPDLIIAAEDIGPPEVVDIFKTLSIPVVFVPENNSLAGIRDKIELIAATLDRVNEGEALAQTVAADFEAAAKLAEKVPAEARRKVVFFHGLLRLTAAGEDTAADAIIGYAGGINPFETIKGYKPASEEVLLDMAPDTILMMGNGNGGPTPEEVFSVPALSATPAAATKSLIVLDGPYMLGFGPRTAGAIRDLATALYPNILASEP